MRRVATVAVAAATLLTACTSGGAPTEIELPSPSPSASAEAAASPSPSPEAVETAAAVDISVVPPVEEMTVAYVEAVVNAIEAESGKLFAAVLAEPVNPLGATPAGTLEGLEALFGADRLRLLIEEAEVLARSEADREGVLPPAQYTGVRFEVLQVSYAEPGCIIAVTQLYRDGTTVEGGPDSALSILSLGLLPDGLDPDDLNPTPWRSLKALSNRNADGVENSDEFALRSTLADFGSALPHDCVAGEESRVAG